MDGPIAHPDDQRPPERSDEPLGFPMDQSVQAEWDRRTPEEKREYIEKFGSVPRGVKNP